MNSSPDYEGYEQLGAFTGPQLQAYREMLLRKTKPQVEFIKRHVVAPKKSLKVLDIGTGNGRLLIGLAKEDMLTLGFGVDISSSRIEFAEKWRDDEGLRNTLFFHNEDILGKRGWVDVDLVACITGCFQYFYPIDPEAPNRMLKFIRASGDYALFELYKKPPIGRTWRRLPFGDPWMYILDEYEDKGDWVYHNKLFLGVDKTRDVKVDRRVENLAYYKMEPFLKHLYKAGFHTVHVAREDEKSMVILVS